jgi:hypothetical protein
VACSATVKVVRVALLSIAGCRSPAAAIDDAHGSSESTTARAGEETGSSSSTETTGVVDGPPEIVDIGGTSLSLGEGESTTITAFVQHPRGEAAIVSGVLIGPGDPAEYGPFVRGASGRWAIDVGWHDVAAHTDFYFEDSTVVEFTVRFVDDAGLVAESSYALPMRCIPLEPYSCDGECTDFDSSKDNCGACDTTCVEQQGRGLSAGGCVSGSCAPIWSICVDLHDYSDCDAACTLWGTYCVPGGCDGHTVMPIVDEADCASGPAFPSEWAMPDDCDVAPLSPLARCCCAQ